LKVSKENKSSMFEFIIEIYKLRGDSNYIALMPGVNAHDDKKSTKPQCTFME
jgi:hypothetical protein